MLHINKHRKQKEKVQYVSNKNYRKRERESNEEEISDVKMDEDILKLV